MHEYDKSSKWLIQNQGKALLRLAKINAIVACKPLQAELVQPRQLPDGLLEVRLADDDREHLFLIEVATYSEKRVHDQILRGLVMVYGQRHFAGSGSLGFTSQGKVSGKIKASPF